MDTESYDTDYEDAAAYVATLLARSFEGLEIEIYDVKPHRPGLRVTLPIHTDYEINEVDDLAMALMQTLYLSSGCYYLITTTIRREGENDH